MNNGGYISKYEIDDYMKMQAAVIFLRKIAVNTPIGEWRRKMKIAATFCESVLRERDKSLKPDEKEKINEKAGKVGIVCYTRDEAAMISRRLTGHGQNIKVDAHIWVTLMMVVDNYVCRRCAEGEQVENCEIRKMLHKVMAPKYNSNPGCGECEFHWNSKANDIEIELEEQKMNKVILLGRLTKDPDVRYTQAGKVVAQLTLAVDRPFKGQDGQKEADFIPCIIWGTSAETIGNNVRKGQRLLVDGRMQTRSYDGKDGVKRYVTEVIVDRFEFIEKKANGDEVRREAKADSFGGMGEEIPF